MNGRTSLASGRPTPRRLISGTAGRRGRPLGTTRLLAVAIGAIGAIGAGCSGSSDGSSGRSAGELPTTSAPASLSADQAAAMANVLFDNYDAKGAAFTAVATSTVSEERIELRGEIDWTTHTGHAVVTATGAEAGITEVFWRDDSVLERRPRFSEMLATFGRPAADFVARPPDPAGRDLDRVLAIVTGLASQQRDNPLLIQQTDGSTFLRDDSVNGVAAQVLRYGQRNLYWLAADDGRLLRFEGNNPTGNRPVVLDITALGPQAIDGPLVEQVVSIDQVREIYDAARG